MRWCKVATMLGGAAACAAALPALADDVPAGEDKRWSANASVVSQYVSRGLRQTWGKPALQAGVDYTAPSGFYAGVWSSQVSDHVIAGAHAEVDTYLGYAATIAHGVELTTGLYRYWYPGARYDKAIGGGPATGYDYTEWMVGAGWRGVSVKLWTTLSNYFGFDGNSLADGIDRGSRGSTYAEANWAVPLPNDFTLGLHIGHEHVRNHSAFSFTDYRIELSRPINKFLTLSAALTGADASAYAHQLSARNGTDRMTLGRRTVAFKLTATY
ncbi:TorF family putative porin [Ralstonia sp. CHL-2022]|uniref:TorF family putative porin n=1 Tax=Ralstonia mojiangensis TaxID=2953895 RepID=A0ABT2L616_9RALS|nr:TorF family putative porin [Ralstonia mojiangensis]MCT7296091.1 TorF family putative porin [Ralstonia mojiangensis]MCT7310564.1 TorF family putative porin [Ralstonia mojiangensis]